MSSDSGKLVAVALQQIVSYLSEMDDTPSERKRLIECLPKAQSLRNLSESHRALIANIQSQRKLDIAI